jgi:hypothetical protein
MRGIDGKRIGARSDRNRACADPQRARRGEPCGARRMRRTGHDENMAARIFVVVRSWRPEPTAPERRKVMKAGGANRRQDGFRNADLRDFDIAAMDTARKQKVTRLQPKERDCARGANCHAPHLARPPIDAARQIHGKDRNTRGVHRPNALRRHAVQIPCQPGAEQRINHQASLVAGFGTDLLEPSFIVGGGKRRIARKAVAIPEKRHADTPPRPPQRGGSHEAVAAIVPGAGDHKNIALPLRAPRRLGYSLAGRLHEREAGCAEGDRQPVRLSHFGGSQKLKHISLLIQQVRISWADSVEVSDHASVVPAVFLIR